MRTESRSTDHLLHFRGYKLTSLQKTSREGVEMSLRRWLAKLLVGAMLTLCPLAQYSLPDQTWQPGVYDGADEDNALAQFKLKLSAVEPIHVDASLSAKIVHTPPAPNERTAPLRVLSSPQTRAPPTL
jgi:hypothetical protein